MEETESRQRWRPLDMNGYQWTVLLAAWLGWGFDVFDGLLFNFVAPNAVPTLLGLEIGTPEAKAETLRWTGILTSVLLIGWGAGGILFGRVADRIGRVKTLLLTMLLYSVGTAACAFAPNIWVLLICRVVASLGIGGEWAAGAAMVAEVVPEKRRVEAGALLYTAAPAGLFLATFVTYQIQAVHFADSPETAWRYVFILGLIPAAVALLVRIWIKEPERWRSLAAKAHPRLREVFAPGLIRVTIGGAAMATIALVTWWTCNAFIPLIATELFKTSPEGLQLTGAALTAGAEGWKALASNMFNLGGLVGTLLTVLIAKHVGRRAMFLVYFLIAATSIFATFGLDIDGATRLYLCFPVGLAVFGIFGSFTFYLPELFPTRLRGTGSGFCYNFGRFIAAFGPFLVGMVASLGTDKLQTAMSLLVWVGAVPLIGILMLPFVTETRGRQLAD